MGSKPKPVRQSPEEKALLRAQLQTLARQDEEINERKRRIIRGQYSSFGGLLKRSGTATTGSSGGTAPGDRARAPRIPFGSSTR